MKKKIYALLLVIVTAAVFFHSTVVGAHAFYAQRKVTPYGDYCNRVSHYGMHHGMINDKQVVESLNHYFGEKGLSVEIINLKGRFVKALIKDGDRNVDTIIFDRRTGRIRSIY